jgi:hypothetical protein
MVVGIMAGTAVGVVPVFTSAVRPIMVMAAAMPGDWFPRRGVRAGGWSIAAIDANHVSRTSETPALRPGFFLFHWMELPATLIAFLLEMHAVELQPETISIAVTWSSVVALENGNRRSRS